MIISINYLCFFISILIIASLINFADLFTVTSGILYQCSISSPGLYFDISNNSTLTVNENTRVNLTFYLMNNGCLGVNLSTIQVVISRWNNSNKAYIPQCTILQIFNKCNDPGSYVNLSCGCLKSTEKYFSYYLTFNATRQDNTNWTWSTPVGKTQDMKIVFSVIYPPRVRFITVDGIEGLGPHLVNRNKGANVLCYWENGNPPTTLRLLDKSNSLLTENKSWVINHKYYPSQCPDVDVVRCEAPRSEVNRSTTLLVECPPIITNINAENRTFLAEQDASFTFSMRTHTFLFNGCVLSQLYNLTKEVKDVLNCHVGAKIPHYQGVKCWCDITGTPPEVKLHLHVYQIHQDGDGPWRLNISNKAGSHHTDFYIKVQSVALREAVQSESSSNAPKGTDAGVTSNESNGISRNTVIILSIVTISTVTVTVIVIVRQRRIADERIRKLNVTLETVRGENTKVPESSCNTATGVLPSLPDESTKTTSTHDSRSCCIPQSNGRCIRCSCQRAEVMHLVFYQSPPVDHQRSTSPMYSTLDAAKEYRPHEYRQYSTVEDRCYDRYLTPCTHGHCSLNTSTDDKRYCNEEPHRLQSVVCENEVSSSSLPRHRSVKSTSSSSQEIDAENVESAHYLTIDN